MVTGEAPNISSVGFTFDEILPSDKHLEPPGGAGTITVDDVTFKPGGRIPGGHDVDQLDTQRRDVNMRTKLFDATTTRMRPG